MVALQLLLVVVLVVVLVLVVVMVCCWCILLIHNVVRCASDLKLCALVVPLAVYRRTAVLFIYPTLDIPSSCPTY